MFFSSLMNKFTRVKDCVCAALKSLTVVDLMRLVNAARLLPHVFHCGRYQGHQQADALLCAVGRHWLYYGPTTAVDLLAVPHLRSLLQGSVPPGAGLLRPSGCLQVSLQCQPGCLQVSLQCQPGCIQVSLQCHPGCLQVSFQCPSGCL